MDDYMKEMMDLKTLVTKTLEKKGVLARIRAELRANVFQAIEEQDHASESEGSESFALLGQCNQRAKELHATPAGKLLTGLVCEYLEWCELDRTMKVYLPELNQPRPYSRSELEELLEVKSEKSNAGVSSDTRPLLLEVLDGYLKSEQTSFVKDSYAVSSSSFPKSSRTSAGLGLKPSMNGIDKGDEDLRGAFESRLTMSNKVVDHMTPSVDNSVERGPGGLWHPETCSPRKDPGSSLRADRLVTPAIDKLSTRRHDESLMDKPTGRISLLGDLPPISGRRGLPPVILSNISVKGNGILSPAWSNSIDVSASGMQIGTGDRGGADGGGSLLKTELPGRDDKTVKTANTLGWRRDDCTGNDKEPCASFVGENRTPLWPKELRHDLHALTREDSLKVPASETAGTLDKANSRGCRRVDFTDNVEHLGATGGENRTQLLSGHDRNAFTRDDIMKLSTSETAVPLDREAGLENSQGVAKNESHIVSCALNPPGNKTSFVQAKCGGPCTSQADTPQMLPSVVDKTTALREKSVSAYFYSESDDDLSVPVEEDLNGDSDGESEVQS